MTAGPRQRRVDGGSVTKQLPQRSGCGLQASGNPIESLNYQLRKVTKARGSFPSDAAALMLLYLAIREVNQKRRSTPGAGTYSWTEALNAFAIQFPDRLPL
ncbi:hypothetical protein MYFR107205_29420 [Mycolicibacterium frederiksbergense]